MTLHTVRAAIDSCPVLLLPDQRLLLHPLHGSCCMIGKLIRLAARLLRLCQPLALLRRQFL